MKYVAIPATITTGNSTSDAVCISEHPIVAVECATFLVETAAVGMYITGSDTATGTYYPINVVRDNVVVPLVATGFAGGGTVVLDSGISVYKYIKVGLVSNTASAACSVRVLCRSD